MRNSLGGVDNEANQSYHGKTTHLKLQTSSTTVKVVVPSFFYSYFFGFLSFCVCFIVMVDANCGCDCEME